MPKVIVVMSTYNGEQYLPVQIESILAQTYSDLTLLIRDDHSSDRTIDIIRDYANKDSRVRPIYDDASRENENLGFGASFSRLVQVALDEYEFEYLAFCDQDDFWEAEKVEIAVSKLGGCDTEQPLLFASNYNVCNQNLEMTGVGNDCNPMGNVTFSNLMFEGVFPGFTMMMNRKLAEIAFDHKSLVDIYYHDKWVSLVNQGYGGTIIYEEKPLAQYRRHESAESATERGTMSRLKWRFNKVIKGDYCSRTQNMILAYKRNFYDDMSADIQQFLDIFTEGSRFQKLTYKKRMRRSWSGEILLRMVILMGKL